MKISLVTNCSHSRAIEPIAHKSNLPKDITQNEAMDIWISRCTALMKEAGAATITRSKPS